MENIFQPNNNFDFSHISLAHPTGIQGGAYFTRIQMHNKPLYIETPKSLTRQGFVKNGKKIYCDLMFDNNDGHFIHWLETLENKCQELIYKKGESWFENKLDLTDIESAFASPIRVYKSGKYYLVRVNVKVNYNTNIPNIKIYNESETPIAIEDVTNENNIISIIEVQGIKFTSRNFQIELELKQAMVMSSEKIFESCLIKSLVKNSKPQEHHKEELVLKQQEIEQDEEERAPINKVLEEVKETITENVGELETEPYAKKEDSAETLTNSSDETLSNTVDNLILSDSQLINGSGDYLTEVELTSDFENLETITLKKPNQVYYEIYKAARKKAKEAKKIAIAAFLEAKNIKKTYMLNELDDSEDSDDSEYNDSDLGYLSETSENDLEKA
jgi:hypothetical protein